ncbi:HK97 family phage prohead protease [Streptomyces sp. NPDC088197]|uniref:HK97 family phage prohead protease n=1 Tax=Streptomyces sp. NPDC088197 TaxID=3365840 RepID=UPI00380DAC3E
MPRTKEAPARIKAAGPADGLAEGEFIAIVSVFGNIDSVGDKVVPGAFTDTLADWSATGDPIPTIWSHAWSDPFSHIGVVKEAEQVEVGLQVRGQIEDLDTNPTAAQVWRLLKGRRVKQFSFAYDVVEGAWVEPEDGPPYYELRKLKLYEVGPCLVGANQETELLAAKAMSLVRGVKEGRVLAQAHVDRLKEAHQALGDVIAAADSTTEPKGSDPTAQETGQPPAVTPASTEQVPAKTSGPSPAQVLARALIRKHTEGGRHGDAA